MRGIALISTPGPEAMMGQFTQGTIGGASSWSVAYVLIKNQLDYLVLMGNQLVTN
jgi:hypothetical protein